MPPALDPLHDFTAKLRQPALHGRVVEYVAWRRAVAAAKTAGGAAPPAPDRAPLSINLDLTTACNYACDHCIDWDLLNSGVSFEFDALLRSLSEMAARGLKSVILIGGGEPTVHPRFCDVVRHLKGLGLFDESGHGSSPWICTSAPDSRSYGDEFWPRVRRVRQRWGGTGQSRLQIRSRRLAVARWIRGSTWPGRSSAGDQANVPDAKTSDPDGARYRDVSWWRGARSLSR